MLFLTVNARLIIAASKRIDKVGGVVMGKQAQGAGP
jgi:hypothetical protein